LTGRFSVGFVADLSSCAARFRSTGSNKVARVLRVDGACGSTNAYSTGGGISESFSARLVVSMLLSL
jgi:hypothetical protein